MRKLVSLSVLFFIIPFALFSQNLTNLEFISPFHDGVAAIKKGDNWAFVNDQGELVVDFRNDFVLSNINDKKYPVFNSDRCLIHKMKDGISYYGYIDKKGNEVMKPEFLNATQFINGMAIVIKLYKDVLGTNDVLDKKMIDYNYMEVAIDVNGDIIHYFSDKPVHVTLSRDFLKKPPLIKTKFIAENLIATMNKDKTWSIKKYKL